MNAKKIRGEFVLIKPVFKDEVTSSGIIVRKKDNKDQSDFQEGIIKMIGTGKINEEKMVRIGIDLSIGDKVLYRYGIKIKIGDEDLHVVNESDVMFVLE